jgi:hypothetical protein
VAPELTLSSCAPKDPDRRDELTLCDHENYGHLEVGKRLLLLMNRSLIFSQTVIPLEAVIQEIWSVDLVRNLESSLVENLVEHAPDYRFVPVLFGGCGRRAFSRQRRGRRRRQSSGMRIEFRVVVLHGVS